MVVDVVLDLVLVFVAVIIVGVFQLKLCLQVRERGDLRSDDSRRRHCVWIESTRQV